SSRLVFRRIRPTSVMRGSLREVWFESERVVSCTYIVRNFSIRKRLPLRLTRSCEKNTGPGEPHLIASVIKAANGTATTSTIPKRQRRRFSFRSHSPSCPPDTAEHRERAARQN